MFVVISAFLALKPSLSDGSLKGDLEASCKEDTAVIKKLLREHIYDITFASCLIAWTTDCFTV